MLKLKLYHDIFNRTLPPLEQLEYQAEQVSDPEVVHRLGMAHFQKLQFSQAAVQFSRAIELNPGAWEPRLHRGLTRVIMGQFEPAIADFSAVLAQEPAQFEALYNRGRILARLRRDGEAIADFQVVQRLDWRRARRLRVPKAVRGLRRRQRGRAPNPLDRFVDWVDDKLSVLL